MDARRAESGEVQAATAGQMDLIARREADNQYFCGELSESRNEVSWLRYRHEDYAEAERWGEEHEAEYEGDELHQWYQATGVGLDDSERVARSTAPLISVTSPKAREPDIVIVARKAAQ
ncbi:MAG: hypothetical protein ACKPKO_08995, partial [Candidatus Fonsibacter sp.]